MNFEFRAPFSKLRSAAQISRAIPFSSTPRLIPLIPFHVLSPSSPLSILINKRKVSNNTLYMGFISSPLPFPPLSLDYSLVIFFVKYVCISDYFYSMNIFLSFFSILLLLLFYFHRSTILWMLFCALTNSLGVICITKKKKRKVFLLLLFFSKVQYTTTIIN